MRLNDIVYSNKQVSLALSLTDSISQEKKKTERVNERMQEKWWVSVDRIG